MKTVFTILLVAIAVQLLAQTQEPDWSNKIYVTGKIYPGFYVTNSNDTVYGYFYHGGKTENQKKCFFYKNEMDKKATNDFKPDDIKSYKVGDKLYRTLNYSGGLLNKPLRFLLVTKDGAITQFVFYSEDGASNAEPVFHKPFDAEHSSPVTMSYFALAFAKKMSDYISDCPAVSKKVADKEKGYGALAMLAVIDEYNACYAAKQKK